MQYRLLKRTRSLKRCQFQVCRICDILTIARSPMMRLWVVVIITVSQGTLGSD